MKRQPSYGFNKEKLIFLGMAVLMAASVYNFLSSRPIELKVNVEEAVSPLPIPAPLAAEKADTRKADVTYYLETKKNAQGVVLVNRDRKNPFEAYGLDQQEPQPNKGTAQPKQQPLPTPPKPPIAPEPAIAPAQAANNKDEEEQKTFDPKDIRAQVDFVAVVLLNGQTVAQVKGKDGQTFDVKVGDYIEDFKYTVAKIEKQAVWVTDDKERMFVARDLSYATDGAGGGGDAGDDKAKKKKPGAKGKKDAKADPTTQALADAAKQLAALQKKLADTNAAQANNKTNGGGRKGGRGGNNSGGNANTFNNNQNNTNQNNNNQNNGN